MYCKDQSTKPKSLQHTPNKRCQNLLKKAFRLRIVAEQTKAWAFKRNSCFGARWSYRVYALVALINDAKVLRRCIGTNAAMWYVLDVTSLHFWGTCHIVWPLIYRLNKLQAYASGLYVYIFADNGGTLQFKQCIKVPPVSTQSHADSTIVQCIGFSQLNAKVLRMFLNCSCG